MTSLELSEDDADTRLEAAIALARSKGDRFAEAEAHTIAGGRAFTRSEFSRAKAHFLACVDRHRELGDPAKTASSLVSLAAVLRAIGDYEHALESLDDAARSYSNAGHVLDEARCLAESEAVRRFLSADALSTSEFMEHVLGLARASRNHRREAKALISMSEEARRRRHRADARRLATLALELSLRFQNVRNISEASCLLAELELEESDLAAAESHAVQAVTAGRTAQRNGLLSKALYVRGQVAERRLQLGRARSLYTEAAHIGPEPLHTARCNLALGRIARRLSDPATADIHLNAALETFQGWREGPGQFNTLIQLGALAASRANMPEANRRCYEALELATKMRNQFLIAPAYQHLGWFAHRAGDRHDCERFHQLALERYRRLENYAGVAECLVYIADNAFRARNLGEAKELFEESLAVRQRATMGTHGLGDTLKGLGDTLVELGELVEARKRLTEALSLFEAAGDYTSAGRCLLRLGTIDQREGAEHLAKDKLRQALRFFVRIPDHYWIGFTHVRLARASAGSDVRKHVERARSAWRRLNRDELMRKLNIEFPPETP